MDISLLISILALAISLTLAVIKILEYRRERINIVLKCEANQFMYGGTYKENTEHVVVSVINRGRRPVTIEKVAYILKDKKAKQGIFSDSFIPGHREITEGKSTEYIAEQSKIPFEEIKYFIAVDSTGRKYKGKLKLK